MPIEVVQTRRDTTTFVKLVSVVCYNLYEINNLPSKTKLHKLKGFSKLSVDKFRSPLMLMLNQEWMASLGKYIGLYNDIKWTLNKIKEILANSNIYYTSLTLDNEWNGINIVYASSCWNCGAHYHRLLKCNIAKNQDHIDAKKISGKKRMTRWPDEVETMSGDNLEEVMDRISVTTMAGQMQIHLVQHRQGLHARMGNGSCIAKKLLKMNINLDGIGRIIQSFTQSAYKTCLVYKCLA